MTLKNSSLDKNNQKVFIFVYGTLKRTAHRSNHNYERFGPQKYICEETISGYQMWDLIGYPAISEYQTPHSQIIEEVRGEIHEVSMETFELLRRMEERAGYSTLHYRSFIPTSTTPPVTTEVDVFFWVMERRVCLSHPRSTVMRSPVW